jgi:Asp/Glu/hydantoin racemase
VSQPFLGILMLDTRFPRPPGDIGHPASFTMPVRWRRVPRATPQRVVREDAQGLLDPFIAAARALVDEGAAAIATGCGFLVLHQQALQAALPVPVWSSALLHLPALAGRRPGVITADAHALGMAHLRAAGASADTPIEGLAPGCAFQRTLLQDLLTLDEADACAQVLAAAQRLRARHADITDLVLECTNLPPHADALRQATGLPVHDVLTLLHTRWQQLME